MTEDSPSETRDRVDFEPDDSVNGTVSALSISDVGYGVVEQRIAVATARTVERTDASAMHAVSEIVKSRVSGFGTDEFSYHVRMVPIPLMSITAGRTNFG